jgi:hypothetical protein
VKRERDIEFLHEAARAEHERTLSEKIYRITRDLNDANLSQNQRRLLRAELEHTLANLEALGKFKKRE